MTRSTHSWFLTEISDYEKPIPAHVLNKAVQVKKALPEVGFHVMHLVRDPDPFLMASLGQENYILEVWDELRFEGRVVRETEALSGETPSGTPDIDPV